MIIRSNSEKVDLSFFRTVGKDFFVKVKLLTKEKVVEGVEVAEMLSVGEGISKGEEDCFLLISELVLKNTLKF